MKTKNIFVKGPVAPEQIGRSIAAHSSKTQIGGHSIFLGQVRADTINEKQVAGIEYTCYEEMALTQMTIIREELFAKYPIECMHVYHSLGNIAAGEICLFVFVSARHRKAAMQACDELVERIKAELPIWGKELFIDDTYTWKENT